MHKAEFNRQIAEVRALALSPDTPRDLQVAAAKRFAELLYGKDLALAHNTIATGFSADADALRQLGALLTGGKLDNGVPADASAPYRRWMAGVRRTLGAETDAQVLILTDPDRYRAALNANTPLYRIYTTSRDHAEQEAFATEQARIADSAPTAKAAEAALLPGGGVALSERKIRGFDFGDASGGGSSDQLLGLLTELMRQDVAVLECRYGPIVGPSGRAGAYVFIYWLGKAPDNISVILQTDREATLARIGSSARDECPVSHLVGQQDLAAARAAHPWSQP